MSVGGGGGAVEGWVGLARGGRGGGDGRQVGLARLVVPLSEKDTILLYSSCVSRIRHNTHEEIHNRCMGLREMAGMDWNSIVKCGISKEIYHVLMGSVGLEGKKHWLNVILYPSAPLPFTHHDRFPLFTWTPFLYLPGYLSWSARPQTRVGNGRIGDNAGVVAWAPHASPGRSPRRDPATRMRTVSANCRVIFRTFYIALCCMTTRRDCTFRDTKVTI